MTAAIDVLAVGIDIERDDPLDIELVDMILSETERRRLELPESAHGLSASKLLFCIKEAVFKCQYPITSHMLDFDDIEVQLDPLSARLRACASNKGSELEPILNAITCRAMIVEGHIIAAAVLMRDGE